MINLVSSVVDLSYQVRNHFPDTLVSKTAMEFEDVRNYRVSSDKIRSELGWRPGYSIDDGIIEIKELIETKRLKDVMNPRYTNQAFLTKCVPELEQFKVPLLNRQVVENVR